MEKILSNGQNKTSLLQFLQTEWSQDKYATKLQHKHLYVTSEESCLHISSTTNMDKLQSEEVPQLTCQHEEADTRLFLHAKHAADHGHSNILIRSSDTDVEVLALHHTKNIAAHIYLQSGTEKHSKWIDVSLLASQLGEDVCDGLPGIHALTGCDSVSAFVYRGKRFWQVQMARDGR